MLVAVAIMGVIAATLATLYEGMTKLMVRSNVQQEADSLQRFLQGILSNRDLCDQMMRGKPWSFPGGLPPTNVSPLVLGGSQIAAVNQDIIPNRLRITQILIQGRDSNNDGNPDVPTCSDAQIRRFGAAPTDPVEPYKICPAEIAIRFDYGAGAAPGSVTGGVLRDRKIPVLVSIRQADQVIDFCDVNVEANRAKTCTAADVPAAQQCTTDAAVCPRFYYIGEVDANGDPVCYCGSICPPDPPDPRTGTAGSTGSVVGNGTAPAPVSIAPPPPPPIGGPGGRGGAAGGAGGRGGAAGGN